MADTTATNDLPKMSGEEAADDESHGPKYHAQQKVLCIDTNNTTSDDASAPLYEAVIRKSELKYIDPTTKKILPKRKNGRGRGRVGIAAIDALSNNNLGSGLSQEWCHHVHFNGWNSRWDRWVTEQDIFDDTIENRKRVSEHHGGKVARPQSKQKENTKKRKRGATVTVENGAENSSSPLHRNLQLITRACELPFTLQTVLCDDRDKITVKVHPPPILNPQQRSTEKAITMLHVIPASTSIVDIMGQYIQTKKQEDLETFANYHRRMQRDLSGNSSCSDGGVGEESSMGDILTKEDLKMNKKKRKEFALSIIALVDASLPLFLLYAEEREQFAKVMAQFAKEDDKPSDNGQTLEERQPSHLYPAQILLRLFVKIPDLLSEFDLNKSNPTSILLSDEKSQVFARFLAELIVFIQKRVDESFTGKYHTIEVDD
mmetsp:Transcript_12804/g.18368  ORF Transcript_12804/g.18368 Transcript_12804/m.18368 type:complete len:431 (+) Transcript_12804:232-1524(+)